MVTVSRSSQSLFFECLASFNRRQKLVLLLTWGVYMLVAEEGGGGFAGTTASNARIERCSYDGRTNCSNGIISLVANTRILKYSQNLCPSISFTPSHAKQTFVSSLASATLI
jgi:hypothetical protein